MEGSKTKTLLRRTRERGHGAPQEQEMRQPWLHKARDARCMIEDGEIAKFCNEQRKEGMMNISSKRCGHTSCNKYASYGVEGKAKTTVLRWTCHGGHGGPQEQEMRPP